MGRAATHERKRITFAQNQAREWQRNYELFAYEEHGNMTCSDCDPPVRKVIAPCILCSVQACLGSCSPCFEIYREKRAPIGFLLRVRIKKQINLKQESLEICLFPAQTPQGIV